MWAFGKYYRCCAIALNSTWQWCARSKPLWISLFRTLFRYMKQTDWETGGTLIVRLLDQVGFQFGRARFPNCLQTKRISYLLLQVLSKDLPCALFPRVYFTERGYDLMLWQKCMAYHVPGSEFFYWVKCQWWSMVRLPFTWWMYITCMFHGMVIHNVQPVFKGLALFNHRGSRCLQSADL